MIHPTGRFEYIDFRCGWRKNITRSVEEDLNQEKKYNAGIGAIVSLFIALLASVPRILKGDAMDYEGIVINVAYTFGIAIMCWITHHFFINTKLPSKLADTPRVKYPLSIAFGVLISMLYHALASEFTDTLPVLSDRLNPVRTIPILIFRGLLVSGFLFFVVYYLNLLSVTQQSKIENERLKNENVQARLNSLKQQISPHFLFNTLNTLSTLTREIKVKEYIAEISNVYRYLLQYKENDLVTVAEELKFIESYLYILHERFEEGLQVKITIQDKTMKTTLPPLALQALVENAVKHNILSVSKPLRLEITENERFIIVTNNFQPKQSLASESSHSGLNNINERYRLLTNKEIVIEKTEQYFIVKLPILI